MKNLKSPEASRYLVVKRNNRFYRVFYSDVKRIKKVEKRVLPKVPSFFDSESFPEETSFEPFDLGVVS